MSQENLDLVVRAIQAATKKPKPDFETVNALYHPDHVLLSLTANALGEGEAKGAAGYKTWLQQTDDAVSWEGELKGAVDVGPAAGSTAATASTSPTAATTCTRSDRWRRSSTDTSAAS